MLEIKREKRSVVAIDGKTISGSDNSKHKVYHVVSAFVAKNGACVGGEGKVTIVLPVKS